VRITAQLIRAAPEQQLWARSYERDFQDVLSLQKEVAAAITQEIKVKLEPHEQKRLASRRLVDPAAFDAYLRGRHLLNRRTQGGLPEAVKSFQEALARDPGFALAHAGLADVYMLAGTTGEISPLKALPNARKHAKAALEIDPDLADAHASLGFVQLLADRNWHGADASLRRAIALQPNHSRAHYFYWLLLHALGRRVEAREQIRLAAELDPLSPIITLNLGIEACLAGQEKEALRLWKKVQILYPDHPTTELYLSVFHQQKGNLEASFQHYRRFLPLRYPEIAPEVEAAFQEGGNKAALEAAARALEGLEGKRQVPPTDLAQLYVLLDRRDKAVDWLEKAYERRSPMSLLFRGSWTLQSLRSEPRFQALIKKID
jgi:tetratricopeptide (TPR) repeat protein